MSRFCDNCGEEPFFGMDECEGCGEENGCEECYKDGLCVACVAVGIVGRKTIAARRADQ